LPRHPPLPTLFPYTTLFRSAADCRLLTADCSRAAPLQHARQRQGFGPRCRVQLLFKDPLQLAELAEGVGTAAGLVVEPNEGAVEDRKSTRLNSSHLVISYAV